MIISGRRTLVVLVAAGAGMFMSAVASAGEAVTYSYDALGRLVQTTSSGTVNNGKSVQIAYDPSGNRSAYTVAEQGCGIFGCGAAVSEPVETQPPPSGTTSRTGARPLPTRVPGVPQ